MASETYQLAIFLSLKDAASGNLDRVAHKLRDMGKEGKGALKEWENLKQSLGRDLAIGGIGLAGLATIKQGVQVAATFQSSMTDLRTTLTQLNKDGATNLIQLGDDMKRAEKIALDLGNALPGTTEDFVQMMQVLKQNGVEATIIFNGAGEAVGKLAVANNAIPKDIAADFAKFGKIFQLKADEYVKAADLFSRIYTSRGIQSGELIESSKYFQGRVGGALKLTGIEGAEQAVRFLAFLRQQGLDSSQAGTASSTMLGRLVAPRSKEQIEMMDEIRKKYGITFDLFDKQKKFKGFDALFEQMQQLQKLDPQKQVEVLNKLFQEEGSVAATPVINAGLDGWKKYNEEVNKTIGLQQKVDEKSKDFNNKMEALTGTLKNLVVTGFTPLLPTLTSFADKANTIVGSLQEFASAHPTLTSTTAYLLTLASAGLVAYSAFRTMQTGWRMWRLMSAISSADGGLLTYLTKTKIAADAAGTSMAGATTKATGLRGALSGLASPIKIAVTVAAVYGLIEMIQFAIESYMATQEAKGAAKETSKQGVEIYDRLTKKLQETGSFAAANKLAENDAQVALAKLNTMGLKDSTREGTSSASFGSLWMQVIRAWTPGAKNPFAMYGTTMFDRTNAIQAFKDYSPELSRKEVMIPFLKLLEKTVTNKDDLADIKSALVSAFPQTFKDIAAQQEAMTQSYQHAQQGLDAFSQPLTQTTDAMTKLAPQAEKLPETFNRTNISVNRASQSLDLFAFKIQTWQPPQPSSTFIPPNQGGLPPFGQSVPSRAIGGIVERDGVAMVHAGNVILPAAEVTRGIRSSNASGLTINYSPQISLNGSLAESKNEFAAMLAEHARDIEALVARRLSIRRERA